MVLLLPVYQPGSHLLSLLAEIPDTPVVVVDDGSDSTDILDQAAALGCTVLRHETNRGKGAALKTGFRHIYAELPDEAVICADADGQHHAEEIRRVAERVEGTGRMTLGVRHVGRKMPLRSRLGNSITEALFRVATGRDVRDTQTGLRGFPPDLLAELLAVPGERFDYEMNVLLYAARVAWPIEQVEIETRYLDGNASSHFGAVSDAVRIYRPLLRFAALRQLG
jgi:glycosyltransferase involved in cell wall biosynthesis